jgi:hypothetical protein
VYVASIGVADVNRHPFIARAPYIGGAFVIVEDVASIRAFYGMGGDDGTAVYAINCNPLLPEAVAYVIGHRQVEIADAFYGTSGTFSQGAHLTASFGYGSLSFGLGKWMFTQNGAYYLLDADMGSVTSSAVALQFEKIFHKRLGSSGTTYHYGSQATIHVGTNNYASNVEVGSLLTINGYNKLAFDTTGQFMLAPWSTQYKGKSSDGGSSWSDMTGLPYVGNIWAFAYAGGAGMASRWIAGSSYIEYSEDFGITWVSKQGNLNSLSPLYSLDYVKAIGF